MNPVPSYARSHAPLRVGCTTVYCLTAEIRDRQLDRKTMKGPEDLYSVCVFDRRGTGNHVCQRFAGTPDLPPDEHTMGQTADGCDPWRVQIPSQGVEWTRASLDYLNYILCPVLRYVAFSFSSFLFSGAPDAPRQIKLALAGLLASVYFSASRIFSRIVPRETIRYRWVASDLPMIICNERYALSMGVRTNFQRPIGYLRNRSDLAATL